MKWYVAIIHHSLKKWLFILYSQQGATNNNLCQADWADLPNNVSSQ